MTTGKPDSSSVRLDVNLAAPGSEHDVERRLVATSLAPVESVPHCRNLNDSGCPHLWNAWRR